MDYSLESGEEFLGFNFIFLEQEANLKVDKV